MSAEVLASIAVDATFAEFGRAATYAVPDETSAVDCVVITDRADREISYGAGNMTREGKVLEVRKSDVAQPVKGGAFRIEGEDLLVINAPRCEDPERLVWTCTIG